MRHPFFNMTRLSLAECETDFHLLEGREGLVITIGPNTSVFDRPGRSVSRWAGTMNVLNKSPHAVPDRSWIMNEINFLMRIFCGGGDVKLNSIQTLSKQREVLLTAGEGLVVEKVDLTELAKEKVPALHFLQPTYLCSSANVEIRSILCDPSIMSWSRAPYVYIASPRQDSSGHAILCISGRTMVWSERLEPGERRNIALGNVIAVTENVVCTLHPTNRWQSEDDLVAQPSESSQTETNSNTESKAQTRRMVNRQKAWDLASATKIMFDSIRAREGFFVCELMNRSDRPAFVYTQLNRTSFYGGSGVVGVFIRMISSLFRWVNLGFGNES
jgi:hypothetical protein